MSNGEKLDVGGGIDDYDDPEQIGDSSSVRDVLLASGEQ